MSWIEEHTRKYFDMVNKKEPKKVRKERKRQREHYASEAEKDRNWFEGLLSDAGMDVKIRRVGGYEGDETEAELIKDGQTIATITGELDIHRPNRKEFKSPILDEYYKQERENDPMREILSRPNPAIQLLSQDKRNIYVNHDSEESDVT